MDKDRKLTLELQLDYGLRVLLYALEEIIKINKNDALTQGDKDIILNTIEEFSKNVDIDKHLFYGNCDFEKVLCKLKKDIYTRLE